MAHIVDLPNGEPAEFPDEMSPEQIEFIIQKQFPSTQNKNIHLNNNEQKKKDILNMGFSTKDFLQDLGAGAMRGGQNIAALLGEGGNAIASLLTGDYAPKVNIREEMGLGNDRPIDLGSLLASKKANPLAMALGQYAPAILSGGATLPGQATAMGLYGATQAQPEQENAFGLLPEGRLGAGIEDAASIFGAGKLISLIRSMPHLTRYGATISLNKAHELAKGRNIGKLNIDPALIEDARQFLPNTLPHRNALTAAHAGDYNELFKLQSDVGKNASDYAKSFFSAAERSHGKAGLAARNRLLDAIHENLQSQGHYDISKFLRQGQRDFSRYMRIKPYRNALALGLLSLAIPQNPLMKIGKQLLFQNNQ